MGKCVCVLICCCYRCYFSLPTLSSLTYAHIHPVAIEGKTCNGNQMVDHFQWWWIYAEYAGCLSLGPINYIHTLVPQCIHIIRYNRNAFLNSKWHGATATEKKVHRFAIHEHNIHFKIRGMYFTTIEVRKHAEMEKTETMDDAILMFIFITHILVSFRRLRSIRSLNYRITTKNINSMHSNCNRTRIVQ